MKKGFTLIEMVFAVGILAGIIVTFVLSMVQFTSLNEINENSSLALNEAFSRIDSVRGFLSTDSIFTLARTLCGTEVFAGSYPTSGIGREGTVTLYVTCKRKGSSECTNNVFDVSVLVCWRQAGDFRVGTFSDDGVNCKYSPIEAKASVLIE